MYEKTSALILESQRTRADARFLRTLGKQRRDVKESQEQDVSIHIELRCRIEAPYLSEEGKRAFVVKEVFVDENTCRIKL